MRLYDLTVGGRNWTSRNNPTALTLECDITCVSQDMGGSQGNITLWGIAKEDISQAQDFANKPCTLIGGMQQGLPFANAQSGEAGILHKGYVYSSFANWVGTDMTLNFVVLPGDPPDQPPPPNAPNPPPKNIILNWKKDKPMADAVKQALQTAYPGQSLNVNISSKLIAPQDNIAYFGNLNELGQKLREVSHQIMTGDNKYPGVGCCMQKGEITVFDGTSSSGGNQIAFIDLIGLPTWIATYTISIKCVMRGDLKIGDKITLPPTLVVTTAAAQSGIKGPLTFQGSFTIQSLRHVGNSRQPDGAAWITVIEALQD